MPLGLSAAELALIGATFLASAVELVETLTIAPAIGLTRGWRSTLAGAVSALLAAGGLHRRSRLLTCAPWPCRGPRCSWPSAR